MKPEKLIICGWGPYKEETVIDLKKMNTSGLFLVTGQTGAGKTTIFDAIAYALYGVLSGDVREKGTVRSDFADPDTKTYVELYMCHKNQSYRICRNPEYLRPKKRKSGERSFTKEKENAVLTMPDGTIIAGNQDVTEKMEELLHMDGKQFRQISMIAQGEFSKMLFADSKEKNAIFRELFGTAVYAQVQAELKNRSANLYREYMVYKNKMEEDVHLLPVFDETWTELTTSDKFDFDAIESYLTKRLKEEKSIVDQLEASEKKMEEELLCIQKEREQARQMNDRFRELEKVAFRLEALKTKKTEIEILEKEVVAVKKAQALFMEEKLVIEKEKVLTELSERQKQWETELSQLKKQVENDREIVRMQEEIQSAFQIKEQIRELDTQIKILQSETEKLHQRLELARQKYEKLQDIANEKNKRYEEADECYKKAIIGIAARLIREGEPCPVCGSLEHPQVAQVSDDIPDEKQLEHWKKEAEESRKEAANNYETALSLTNEEKQCEVRLSECHGKGQQLQEMWDKIQKEVQAFVFDHTFEEFDRIRSKYLESNTRIAEKERQLQENRAEYQERENAAKASREELETAIVNGGFSHREEYESALNHLTELEKWEREVRLYQDEFVATENLHVHLQEALAGRTPIEETTLSEAFSEKQKQKNECRKVAEESNLRLNQIQRSLEGIRKNREQADRKAKEYGVVKDLDDLANGNNARRLVFEQFVLAGYFERILQAANLRLTAMSDGRYELQRAHQVSDGRKKDNLEILVMDYYTGRKRSVKTLSGGEIFKASLALALGMSDCIQAENGGTEVETLFIDEGFGALDEESLEQACNTLQTLAGNNRMVGIISHVAQLRERIEHQIVIEKRNNGSYVKVC